MYLQESNRALIERTFSTAIVRCKMLAPQQACQLFVLMLDNVEHIFQCPADVQLAVTARRQHFVRGLALGAGGFWPDSFRTLLYTLLRSFVHV
jgi:hypothetical protein